VPTNSICAPDYSDNLECSSIDSQTTWSPYACSGPALPTDDTPSDVCWAAPGGGADAGASLFCCTGAITDGCYRDPEATFSAGWVPYRCLVGEEFNNFGSTFNCGSDDTPVCCSTEDDVSTACTMTTSSSCSSDETAYSCTGINLPDDGNSLLACDQGAIGDNASAVAFCCIPYNSGNCTVSHLVEGCNEPQLYAFSCTSGVRPETADAKLTCSVGVDDATVTGAVDYCCSRD
jgi:hypothetical protein